MRACVCVCVFPIRGRSVVCVSVGVVFISTAESCVVLCSRACRKECGARV